ncbi:hypothetical protein GCM10028792_05380 [Salinisphaera aquimarina]
MGAFYEQDFRALACFAQNQCHRGAAGVVAQSLATGPVAGQGAFDGAEFVHERYAEKSRPEANAVHLSIA